MKRLAKILLTLFFAAAVVFGILLVWQWRNVKIFYTAKTSSAEEILQKASASKEQQRVVLEENEIPLAPPSLNQLDRLIEGQASSEELKTELGLGDGTGLPAAEGSVERGRLRETEEELTKEQREIQAKEKIDGCVRDLLAYEVDLVAGIGALKQEALDEYRALPVEEQTRENALKIGYQYLGTCYGVEVESDKVVQSTLERLRGDLEALEADTSIVDTLWEHYCEEKTTTKEYYLSKYL